MKKRIAAALLLLLCFSMLSCACKNKNNEDAAPAFNEDDITSESVTVTEPTTIGEDSKILYLTFDDGPGAYTQHLLATLAKYNVKVTFFVTNFRPEWRFLLTREAKEGHTVAVHSYSHEYSNIYSSTSAYWEDFNKMDDVVLACTGHRTEVMRFPGGSSNTISSSYCSGIMTTLTRQMLDKGISYIDWDVDSYDAGGASSSEEVVENLQRGVSDRKVSVILCHDVKSYTVEAMETFIPWALEEGYIFLPCTPDSNPARHSVNN